MFIKKALLISSTTLLIVCQNAEFSYAQESSDKNTINHITNISEKNNSSNWESLLVVIAGMATGAMSLVLLPVSKALSNRSESEEATLESKQIDNIAKAVQAESEREKNTIIRTFVQNQPVATEADILEIRNKLHNLDLEASVVDKPIKSAIEGLVSNYHSQALRQSSIQFYFSLAAASIGFGLIIYAGISAVNTGDSKKLLNTLPGAVISGVSVLFFKQAEDTRKRATDLYDRLRSDERQSKAILITNNIEVKEVRSLVQAQLALHLAEVKDAKPIDLGTQISKLISSNDSINN